MRRGAVLALSGAAILVLIALALRGGDRRAAPPPREPPAVFDPFSPVAATPALLAGAAPSPAAAPDAASEAAPTAAAPPSLLDVHWNLAVSRVGPALRALLDPVEYTAGVAVKPIDLVTLLPEDRAALLALLDAEDPEVRFRAIVALSTVALEPAEVEDLVRRLDAEFAALRDPSGSRMAFALAWTLACHGERAGTARMASALRTGEAADVKDFRSGAALVVALTAAPEDGAVLRDLVLADPDRAVRKHAAIGLGRLGGAENADVLGQALLSEGDLEVRAWAALARGLTSPDGAPPDPALVRALAEDRDGEVRGAAAFGLSRAAPEDAVRLLVEAFRRDEHAMARVGAAAGLGRHAGAADADAFLAAEAVPFLAGTATGHEQQSVRMYAVRALALLPVAEGRAEALRRCAAADGSPWVRIAAVESLAATERERAREFLVQRLVDEKHGWVKDAITRALDGLPPPAEEAR